MVVCMKCEQCGLTCQWLNYGLSKGDLVKSDSLGNQRSLSRTGLVCSGGKSRDDESREALYISGSKSGTSLATNQCKTLQLKCVA